MTDLKESLNRLVDTRDARATLPPLPAARAIPAAVGVGRPAGGAGGGGGAIASPLTETAYADRQWHTTQTVLSSDGLFTMQVKPLKYLKLNDANGEIVEINFSAPPAP